MPRYHNINGVRVQFTAEEETARDNEEAAYAAGELNRSLDRLRVQRNQKLAETDYLAVVGTPSEDTNGCSANAI